MHIAPHTTASKAFRAPYSVSQKWLKLCSSEITSSNGIVICAASFSHVSFVERKFSTSSTHLA